jgi:hypothetical protein
VKADPLLCEAILRLRVNEDWRRVVAYLEASRMASMNMAATVADDVPLRRAQGAYAALSEVLSTIADADKTYQKFKGNTQ